MITVTRALSYDVCSNFRLVAGEKGLNNVVYVVGFFEWEEGEKIISSFIQGTFVLTTLSMFQQDIKKAEQSLKLMINNGVSGIAIKDIFFSDISDELKAYANSKRVPIFFFSETYINNIIYVLQNAIENQRKYSVAGTALSPLIKEELPEDKQIQRLEDINPNLEKGKMLSLYFSDTSNIAGDIAKTGNRYDEAIFEVESLLRGLKNYESMVYSFVNYQRGFFLFIHDSGGTPLGTEEFLRQFRKQAPYSPNISDLFVGMCEAGQAEDVKKQLRRTIFANVKAILDEKHLCRFSELNMDYLIFENIESKAAKEYYDAAMAKIKEAEANHTPFMETLKAYSAYSGSVDMTAKELHQHRNTIRYRIEKVRSILGAEDIITFNAEIHTLIRTHSAKPYLENLI